jgi:hypothetical protein
LHIVEFTGQSLIRLDVDVDERKLDAIVNVLQCHMHRLVEMTLSVDYERKVNAGSLSDIRTTLTEALTTPAPRLRKFVLLDCRGLVDWKMRCLTLFNGTAPALETFKIQCDIQALGTSSSTLKNVKKVMFAPAFRLTRSDIEMLVRLFPSLVELSVELDIWSGFDDLVGTTKITLPPTTRILTLIPNRLTANPGRFIDLVDCQAVPRMWVYYNKQARTDSAHGADLPVNLICGTTPDDSGQKQITARFRPKSMSIALSSLLDNLSDATICLYVYGDEDDLHRLVPVGHMQDGDEEPRNERVVGDVHHNAPIFHPRLFANITNLHMAELMFDREVVGPALPLLPALLNLTIRTIMPRWHSQVRVFSAFIVADLYQSQRTSNTSDILADSDHAGGTDEPPRLLLCPLLRTLRIAAPMRAAHHAPTILTPGMVTAFVKTYLRYDVPRLDALLINGIQFVVTDPMELQYMFDLAADVHFDDRYLAWRYNWRDTDMLDWS